MDDEYFDLSTDVKQQPSVSDKKDNNDVVCDLDALLDVHEPVRQENKDDIKKDNKPKFEPTNKKKKKKKGPKLNINKKFGDGDYDDNYDTF